MLLDEIHWLIENERLRFMLCGSSTRKVKRGHANLLGGRAVRYELFPLVFPEIPDFNLTRALNHGLLPKHWFEIDFVIGDGEIAIEAKSADSLRTRHLKSLRAFREEFNPRRSIVVSLDPAPRTTEDGIDILPWNVFLKRLWAGEIVR